MGRDVNAKGAATPAGIRTFVARHGVEQQLLADRLGVCQSRISRILRADLLGKRVTPGRLEALAEAARRIVYERDEH